MKTSRKNGLLGAAVLLLAAVGAGSLDTPQTLKVSYQAFLEGRLQDAGDGYRNLSSLGLTKPDPNVNLAIVTRDLGDPDAALPLWIKATLSKKQDPFLWNQRGWAYLAVNRLMQAKKAFRNALDRSTNPDTQVEASLGLGMATLNDSHPRAALSALRAALAQGPNLIPAASYIAAQTSIKLKDKQAAMGYLRQSITLDPMNLESTRALARLYRDTGQNQAARRAFHRILILDRSDEEAAKRLKKLSEFLGNDSQDWRPVQRITRPTLDPLGKGSPKPNKSPMIRVALFSDSKGEAATLTRLIFMTNSAFRVEADKENIREGEPAYREWEISFRSEGFTGPTGSEGDRIVVVIENSAPLGDNKELHQTNWEIQEESLAPYKTKNQFLIAGKSRTSSILLKSAVFAEEGDYDPADRELRGTIEIHPNPYGFTVVNELPLEEYLYGAVGAALPSKSPFEAYKAQAVLSRTKALWFRANHKPTLERTDICDSAHCQTYFGTNTETRSATRAVAATYGQFIRYKGKPAHVTQHANCGGVTEPPDRSMDAGWRHLSSVHDAPVPLARFNSPFELERWIRSFPSPKQYCDTSPLFPPAESRWVRILDAKEINKRIERLKPIGWLQHIMPLRRSPTGRIKSLRIIGTNGSLDLKGHKEIQNILSPGSLRSTLFTVQTLSRRGRAKQIILWGAGSGHGLGMCTAGAVGQAFLRRKYPAILTHYFPNLDIPGVVKAKKKPADRRRRRKLPRGKKEH